MKPIVTLLILFSSFFSVRAQTTFAPAGADWYYHMNYGVFHCYNAGTTTITGKTCNIIMQVAQTAEPWNSMGLEVSSLGALFTYTSGDTVFVYSGVFSRLIPLYIFNVSEGDTLCLPNFYSMGAPFDSTFCFRVDSVKMVLYDTALLKTVYTHSYEYHWMGAGGDTIISSYGYNAYGAYAERLGGVTAGIYPECRTCPVPTSEIYQLPRGIRCYTDADYSVKLVSGICGIPPTSVVETEVSDISIFPNPAAGQLNINVRTSASIELIAIDGKQVLNTKTDKNGLVVLDVTAIPAGLYFVRVAAESGVYYRRVVVSH